MKSYRKIQRIFFNTIIFSIVCVANVFAQHAAPSGGKMDVGVARIDITPEGTIRMGGHIRKGGSEGGVQPFDKALYKLNAKALAFGSDEQGPSVLITVDLIGIPGHITSKVARRLHEKIGFDSSRLAISASHTHSGPEVGNLLNLTLIYSDPPVSAEELVQIGHYQEQLVDKLERVALAALKSRTPALVSWGQGKVGFAMNRRLVENGKWIAQRNVPKGPVDHSLPLLKVTDLDGNLRAVFLNYACHCTTLGGDIRQMHGDWNGEAQRQIEANHPYATALVASGCGADANPEPRGKMEYTVLHGKEIADEVERLLAMQLKPLNTPPAGRLKHIQLPFNNVPTVNELSQQIKEKGPKAYNASLFLDQLIRGKSIPSSLTYPVQTWTFGNDLAMLFLGGEVVVDYSLRLKKELGADRMWVNAYSNDVACYIPSRRVLGEGGYEAEGHIYYYNQPSRLADESEDLIVSAVHQLLPASFKEKKDGSKSSFSPVPNVISLNAENGKPIGPKIKYMPEWRAYGWFTSADKVEWNINVPVAGEYNVHLEWSVSDSDAGKPFVLEAGKEKISGMVGKTGSWETYRSQSIGRLKLAAGTQKIVFRPQAPFKDGALLDLREVTLVH